MSEVYATGFHAVIKKEPDITKSVQCDVCICLAFFPRCNSILAPLITAEQQQTSRAAVRARATCFHYKTRSKSVRLFTVWMQVCGIVWPLWRTIYANTALNLMAAAENCVHYWLTINESHPVSAIGNLLCINEVETSGTAIKVLIVSFFAAEIFHEYIVNFVAYIFCFVITFEVVCVKVWSEYKICFLSPCKCSR